MIATGDDSIPVEVTALVDFSLRVVAHVRPLGPGLPPEAVAKAQNRVQALLDGSREQVEAAIYAELEKRLPGLKFGEQ